MNYIIPKDTALIEVDELTRCRVRLTVNGRLPLQSWPHCGGPLPAGFAGSLCTGAGGKTSSGTRMGSILGAGGGLQQQHVQVISYRSSVQDHGIHPFVVTCAGVHLAVKHRGITYVI